MQNQNDLTIQQIMQLANSPAGRQLIHMLQQNGGEGLQQALAKASDGDYTQAKQSIAELIRNPKVKELLDQLGRQP